VPGLLAADLVSQLPAGCLNQPAAGAGRHALGWPAHGGRDQGLLHGVLGAVEAAGAAQQHSEDLRRELAQQVLGGLWSWHPGFPSSQVQAELGVVRHDLPHLDRLLGGHPTRAGDRRQPGRDLDGALLRLDIEDLVAG
jgi:hypothetical protein